MQYVVMQDQIKTVLSWPSNSGSDCTKLPLFILVYVKNAKVAKAGGQTKSETEN